MDSIFPSFGPNSLANKTLFDFFGANKKQGQAPKAQPAASNPTVPRSSQGQTGSAASRPGARIDYLAYGGWLPAPAAPPLPVHRVFQVAPSARPVRLSQP